MTIEFEATVFFVILKFFTYPSPELLRMGWVLMNIPWYHGSVVVVVALTESFHCHVKK